MAHDVFVSYSNKDKAVADSIVAALEKNGIRCWYAPRDIKPSEDWGKAITNGIVGGKVFLIIFSSDANRSQRVLDEINFAITREITILPYRIENLVPDGAMELHLSSRHWLDAYEPSWESHIKTLVKNVSVILETDLDVEQIKLPIDIAKKVKAQKMKTGRIFAAISLGALLILAGIFGMRYLVQNGLDDAPDNEDIIPDSVEILDEQEPTETATAESVKEKVVPEIYGAPYIESACNADLYGCAVIEPGQTIKIGMGLPLSGQSKAFGMDAMQSGLLAIADSKGLNGYRFELIAKDDEGTPKGGAAVASEFVADPTVVAIAGHAFSRSTAAALPDYEAHGLPVVNVSASNSEFLEIGSTVFNHLSYTDKAEGFTASEYIYRNLGAKKIAILHSYDDFGKVITPFVNTGFEALGGDVIAFGNLEENPQMISEITNNQVDVIYFCGLEGEMSIIELMDSPNLENTVFFGCASVFDILITQNKANAEGNYFTILREPSSSVEKDRFDANYLKVYGISSGVLTPLSWYSYDSTMILIDRVKEVALFGENGTLYVPRGALAEAVRQLENYVGISGTYSCDILGDCNVDGPQIIKIVDGEPVPVG